MIIEDLLEKLAFDYHQTIVSANDQRISPDVYHAYTIEDHTNF
jgi:hypothetical protein